MSAPTLNRAFPVGEGASASPEATRTPQVERSEAPGVCAGVFHEIRIKGHLDDRRSGCFEGMTITPLPNGETKIVGPIADQPALHGLLNRISNLGMPLLLVRRVERESSPITRQSEISATETPSGTVLVRTENLGKTYQMGNVQVTALNLGKPDLEVLQGEFLAIMGPSGSGKSTLLHILGGIARADSGKVWIGGKSLSDMDETRLTLFRREKIGFVFQFFNLIPTLTVEENVALPLLIAGRHSKRTSARIGELLDAVGLFSRRRHKPSQLSGGEQQRVAIARAFVTDPQVILLDEPTGNLDSKTGARILELLTETHRRYQTTIVLVTHSPVAAAYTERTIFIRDGAIIASLERNTAARYDAEAINHKLLQIS